MKKYEEIALNLQKRINQNEFTTKLPTEDQLINAYQVSRNTIRNAINSLVKMGIVYPIQGSGMFIRPPKKENTICLNGTRGITVDSPSKEIITQVLKLEVIKADEQLSQAFCCAINTPIYYIERVRFNDGQPFAVEYTYYNKDIIPYIGREIAEKSIYKYIKEDLKLTFGFSDKYLKVIKLNEYDSSLLQLEKDDPGLEIEDRVYLNNGQIFNISHIIYNYKSAYFYVSSI